LNGEKKLKALRNIELPYKAKIKDRFRQALVALYLLGAEEINNSDKLGIKVKISKKIRVELYEKADFIVEDQFRTLEKKLAENLQYAYYNNLTLYAVLLMLSVTFADFMDYDKTLGLGIQAGVAWGLQKGRWGAVEQSDKIVIGKVFSAVLDDRTCELCLFLDRRVMWIDNSDFNTVATPFHFRCRCVELPVYNGEQITEGERAYVRPSDDLINHLGSLIPKVPAT